MLCPVCNARVTLQATSCHACSFDIATRDATAMKAHANRDLAIALGLLLLGPICGGLWIWMAPWSSRYHSVVSGRAEVALLLAALFGFIIGGTRTYDAYRRLSIAHRFQRVPAARVVSRDDR